MANDIVKHIKMGIFPYEVRVVLSDSVPNACLRYANKVGLLNADKQYVAVTAPDINGRGHAYIFFHEGVEAHIIAHESYHAMKYMMEFIGAEFEEEVEAYCLEYIVKSINKIKRKC